MIRAHARPLALLALGALQMIGATLGVPALSAVARATAASPAPKVFTTQAGYEAFSTRFVVEVEGADGGVASAPLTPERYAGVAGAYNRRNAYGAALAGAPLLRSSPHLAPMLDAVAAHAVCGDAPVLHESGLGARAPRGVRVEYRTRPGVAAPAPFEVDCRAARGRDGSDAR